MPTRFRLPSTGSPVVSPAWESYTHADGVRRPLPVTDASALTTVALTPDAADHLVAGDTSHFQGTSESLAAQTIAAQTVTLTIQGLEPVAANNLSVQLHIKLVSADGLSTLATLLSKTADASEFGGGLSSRSMSRTTSAYTIGAGDAGARIVVEISVSGTPISSGSVDGHNASLRWGSNGAAGDLAASNGITATDQNPWLEFANTLTFSSEGVAPPAIPSGASLAAPSLAYVVATAAIAAGSALFAPAVAQTVAPPAIASTVAFTPPAVDQNLLLAAPTIASGSTLAAPSVAYAAPTLAGQFGIAAVGSGNLTVSLPPHQEYDIAVVGVFGWVPNTSGDASAIAAPDGWAEMAQVATPADGEIDGRIAWFWQRVPAGGLVNPVFTRPPGWDIGATDTCFAGAADVIRGCAITGNPWDQVVVSSLYNTAAQAFQAVAVSGQRRLVMQFGLMQDDAGIGDAPAGWTAGNNKTTSAGTDGAARTYRKDSVSSSTSADASNAAAPAQGFYAFLGVSFRPPGEVQDGVALPVIASSASLAAPAVAYGATGAAIPAGSTLFVPAVTTTAQVELPEILSGAALSAPSVNRQGEISAPAIGSGSALNAPSLAYVVNAPTIPALILPSIASGIVLGPPSVLVGGVPVSPPAMASTVVLHAPAVLAGAVTVSPPPIPAGALLHAPSSGLTASTPAIGSGAALIAPSVAVGDVVVAPPGIASEVVLYGPGVFEDGAVSPPEITSGVALHAPAVLAGDITVSPPAIASEAVLHAPAAFNGGAVTLPTITSGAVLYPAAGVSRDLPVSDIPSVIKLGNVTLSAATLDDIEVK